MLPLSRLVAGCVSVLFATSAAAQLAASRVSPQVTAQLDAGGAADVFVLLRDPSYARSTDLTAQRSAVHSLCAQVLAPVRAADIRVQREFAIVSGFVASASRAGVAQLLADPIVLRVEPMRYGSGALAESVPQVRADAVHRRGDLGEGVTVATLDTGVDPTTPDIAGSVAAEHCFCSGDCCPDGSAEQVGTGSALTRATHGNHVAGIIVSKGIIAPTGVAPAAKLVAVKVLDDRNRGFLGDWISGLEWIATEHPEVRAINMSLVSDTVFPGTCDEADGYNVAFAQVIGMLRARGTLTFVASGNAARVNAIGSPACITGAVSVGAVRKDDEVWPMSNADAELDLLAPGVDIVSTGLEDALTTLSGTSMATPHATGTAALLIALNPTLNADEVEGALKRTGVRLHDLRNGLTFPRINALGAMNAVLDAMHPVVGGGSGRRDCLVEWNVIPTMPTTRQPISGAVCHDNDPRCDSDQTSGQCTFSLSLCFNVPDPRLTRCATDAPIVSYQRAQLRSADPLAAANTAALEAVLPPLPITTANLCTDPFDFLVPSGAARWIQFGANAADGRRDYDRLRFTCRP